jgi:hypothetical protein
MFKSYSAIEPVLSKAQKKTTVSVEVGQKKREISANYKRKIEIEAAKKKKMGLAPGASVLAKREKLVAKKEMIKKAKGGFDIWQGFLFLI